MNAWYWCLPVLAAFGGWLSIRIVVFILFHPVLPVRMAGITWQGIIPAKQVQLAEAIGNIVAQQLISFPDIEAKMTHPDVLQKIMPAVETQIDHFLRVKLGQAMPMVGMFIGDKTIQQMKSIFMEELTIMFPALIGNYIHTLRSDIDAGKLVADKIATLAPTLLQQQLYTPAARQLHKLALAGIFIGFLTGLLQWLLLAVTA